jgi:hypothetical protein
MFLAKSRGNSEAQLKSQEAANLVSNLSASATPHVDSLGASAPHATLAESAHPIPAPVKPQPALSDAHIQSPAAAVPVDFASPVALRAAHASIFSSPVTCSSPSATSAGDTALLSAQVVDLRRRLAECEREKDANSHEHAIRIREALEKADELRLELQEARDQAFEDSEALRVLHHQALDSLGAEISRMKVDADTAHSQKTCDAQRLHSIEAKLAEALSRLDIAQQEHLEQTTLCSRAQAREEELKCIVNEQTKEISSASTRLNASLSAFQQRERELLDRIQFDSAAHLQVVADLQSHIATLSTDLKDSKTTISILQEEIEGLRNSSNTKPVADSISAAAEAEVAKLRCLLQESTDKSAIELSKLQAESNLKEQQLAFARHELMASQAAITEATIRESNLKLQVQSLQFQLNQNKSDIQVQKSSVSSPAMFLPGDSSASEVSSRRVADIERKYIFVIVTHACHYIMNFDSGTLRLLPRLALVRPSFHPPSRESSPA